MAFVKDLKTGDKVSHYGSFRDVISNRQVTDGNFELLIQENDRQVPRIENGKTNLAVEGE